MCEKQAKGGNIGLFVEPIRDVRRVLAYSDGIASLRERLGYGIGDEELAREVKQLGEMPTSDDISFLEINIRPELAPMAARVALPVPLHVVAKIVNGRISALWDPVPGVEAYELEWTDPTGASHRETIRGTRWVSLDEAQGGEYTLRVRALTGEQSSSWSVVQRVSVSTPTLPVPLAPPRRRFWLIYAGAAAVFVILCLLALAGGTLVKNMVAPQQTTHPLPATTATWVVNPTTAVSSMVTAISTANPTVIPGPVAILLTRVSPTRLPQTPTFETPYRLSKVPPRVAPLEGEEASPEGAMVVVGGMGLHIEGGGMYSLRIAQQELAESEVRFSHQDLPPEVSLDQVQWVWLVYRKPQAPSEPVLPVMVTLIVDGQEILWGPVEMREERESWVYGVNSQAGLCHFITQGCPIEEPDIPILVKGSWHQRESDWQLQVDEWYRFDRSKRVYVPVE